MHIFFLKLYELVILKYLVWFKKVKRIKNKFWHTVQTNFQNLTDRQIPICFDLHNCTNMTRKIFLQENSDLCVHYNYTPLNYHEKNRLLTIVYMASLFYSFWVDTCWKSDQFLISTAGSTITALFRLVCTSGGNLGFPILGEADVEHPSSTWNKLDEGLLKKIKTYCHDLPVQIRQLSHRYQSSE